jgi:hypothetical protein
LIVLDDGAQSVENLMPDDARVRYVREGRKTPIGVKRNRLCELARGDWVAP